MNKHSSIIEDVLNNKNCQLARKAHNRRVYYHKHNAGIGHYVKVFELPGLFSFFLLIKIRNEIKKHIFLKNKGLALPELIGAEKRKNNFFIVTEEIKQGIVLNDYITKKCIDEKRKNFLKSVACFLSDNYKKGFMHNDLHFGNIIWSEPEEKFYFLDPKEIIYRKKFSYIKLIKNFSLLYNSLLIKGNEGISLEWGLLANQFLISCGLEKYRGLLEKYRLKNYARWLSKRIKRCFKVNSDFSFFKKKNYSGYYYNPVMEKINITAPETVDFILGIFESGQTEYLKNSNTTAVAKIKCKNVYLAVKRFNVKRWYYPLKNFFRKSRAYVSWYWAWRFNLINLPVPAPVFFCEKRVFGLLFESYYAMSFENENLNVMDYLNSISSESGNAEFNKKNFLRELARFVIKCGNAGMIHRDFQLKNILVGGVENNTENPEYNFKLIDLESVKSTWLSFSKINGFHLRQLKKSFLRLKNREIFSIKDILFFLKIVLKSERNNKQQIKRLLAS